MNESVKLYEAAEMGNEKLKKVIQTKDSKLQQAEMELVKLRKVGLVKSVKFLLHMLITVPIFCFQYGYPAVKEIFTSI